jgi:hypothetical protein
VEVSVGSTFEVGLLAEDKVKKVVVEFVVHIDEDWDRCQRRPSQGEKI